MASRKKKMTKDNISNHFELRNVKPLTANQQDTFRAYDEGKNLVLHGYAGTGKSFVSLYLALEEILDYRTPFNKVVIIRSVVPSRDMGFLPGSIKEKIKVYEEPYKEICDNLFGRGDGYDILKTKRLVEFTTTSYLRGLTFNDSIVIVDELQNMSFAELDTVMTRMGDNSRVMFCGDFRQTDLQEKDRVGLMKFLNITKRMENFEYIEFGKQDIVRSGIVRDYIIKKTEMEHA
jgi:phosphate starvation-inducible protein PhoH